MSREAFIALDLEYDTETPFIWLVGACIVSGDRREYLSLWADDPREERRHLRRLEDLLAELPDYPVVTWSGETADLPQLRLASQRMPRLRTLLETLADRHIDLYQLARRSLRLPVPGLTLKEVSTYFGIPLLSRIRNGLQAHKLHRQYQSSGDPMLRDQLIDYNRQDLEILVAVADEIRGRAAPSPLIRGASRPDRPRAR